MSDEYRLQHHEANINGLNMHWVECGEGPAVLLLHGFPEFWYSWRHQLPALARAGYRAIAPDMRGAGRTDAPQETDAYTYFHLVGDAVALLDELGIDKATVIGHDWGGAVAWDCALFRPDRFDRVVSLSVDHQRQFDNTHPLEAMKAYTPDTFNHILRHQEEGVSERELEADVRNNLHRFYYTLSGEAGASTNEVSRWWQHPRDSVFMDVMAKKPGPMNWLSKEDLEVFIENFERTGFRGGLNYYRCLELTWELKRAFKGKKIEQPSMHILGTSDIMPVYPNMLEVLRDGAPGLRSVEILEGCGHWTQQERHEEVNNLLIKFLQETA